MTKKALLTIGTIILISSALVATRSFRKQVGQYCGGENLQAAFKEEQTSYFLGEWRQSGQGQVFVQCVGPAEYMTYKPYDLAAILLLSGVGLTAVGLKKRHG